MRWRRGSLSISLLVIALTIGFIPPAGATNCWGPTGNSGMCIGGNKADNKTHTYYPASLSSPWANVLSYVHFYVDDTVVNMQIVASPTTATDQVVYDRAYTTRCGLSWWDPVYKGAVGFTNCVSTNSWGECEKHEVRVTTTYTPHASTARERNVMLHETGHALGLKHRNVTGEVMQEQPTGVVVFSLHDKNHFGAL